VRARGGSITDGGKPTPLSIPIPLTPKPPVKIVPHDQSPSHPRALLIPSSDRLGRTQGKLIHSLIAAVVAVWLLPAWANATALRSTRKMASWQQFGHKTYCLNGFKLAHLAHITTRPPLHTQH